MSDLRENKAVGMAKDLFLIFIVLDIDVSELSGLQPIVNDTHVCRKICIERKGRTLIWSSKNGHPVKRLLPKENYSQKHLGFCIPKMNGVGGCYKTFRYT